jgi:hypothetical protein
MTRMSLALYSSSQINFMAATSEWNSTESEILVILEQFAFIKLHLSLSVGSSMRTKVFSSLFNVQFQSGSNEPSTSMKV